MAALFVFGTLWFWLLLALAVIVIGAFVANDRFGKATLSMIAFFGLLALFGDFNVLKWIADHAVAAVVYTVAYLAIGTGWAVAKWWFFVRRLRERYDRLKTDFLNRHGYAGGPIPDTLKREWIDSFAYTAREFGLERTRDGYAFPPRASSFKGKITSWMVYWPWSLIVTMIDDPIRKLFRSIYSAIQGMLQRMSDRAFAGTERDFIAPPAAPAASGSDASPSGNGARDPHAQGPSGFRGDDLNA